MWVQIANSAKCVLQTTVFPIKFFNFDKRNCSKLWTHFSTTVLKARSENPWGSLRPV